MNKLLLALVALTCGSAFGFADRNPIPRMFPRDLSFLLTFDDDTAQPDVGAVDAKNLPKCETAEGGVIGRCLTYGHCTFGPDVDGQPLVDMLSAGTFIGWVRYVGDLKAGRGPSLSLLEIAMVANDQGKNRRFLLMQRGDIDVAETLYECTTDKRHAYEACVRNRYRDWPQGEWKMFAVTWTRDKIGISVDGAPLYEVANGNDFSATARFSICAPKAGYNSERFYQIDECAVIKRKLSDDEIKAVYNAFRGNQPQDLEAE